VHVPALVAVGEAGVGSMGDGLGVERAGEIRRLDHDSRLGIEFDLDLVAGRDPGSMPVGLAEAEQEAAAHDGDPALPRMPIDRDDHLLASTERSTTSGELRAPHGLRRLDARSKLHGLLLPRTSERTHPAFRSISGLGGRHTATSTAELTSRRGMA
jgi:hypothetical protein